MEAPYSQIICDFLSETEPLIEGIDKLSAETAVELYDMLGAAAAFATLNISQIDPELRVMLCDKQDKVLERIIDTNLSYTHRTKHRIYTPAVQGYRRWSNVELLKDKCLTGYMLANEIDSHSAMMFCTEPTNYPYKEFLPELEILYSSDKSGERDVYYRHLLKEHYQMDTLILHGMYNETIVYLDAYRKLRADGKVYCGLDMNRYWMEQINWDLAAVRKFSTQCDIVATSCRSLRDALNRNPNVRFPCRWLPNAFYNSTNTTITADAKIKKNIILTVGRIGTDQKNNEELLLAFAQVEKILRGWSLRLIGPVEPSFQPFIDQFFHKYPLLRSRIIFTGAITDKNELFSEYAQAKLFALTSRLEGGTPNVYAEALFHGCMFVTSDIDAAADITNFGSLGLTYKCGDIDALSNALIKLTAIAADRTAFGNHIIDALDYANKYFDWRRNAKKLAYMLYG